ncbi:5293_t:CDS:2 [Funneliformis geosporum]|uniref:5293_t:CDS:1 n=1 Tax=Funneliformis geosporum TaxID=1117311 RepID=A0A9W4WN54_9GLOM|nr:5293_t:CDS:2 [Funneliformis geosporum]
MLIEEVGKQWQSLQKVRDDRIINNIQTFNVASLALKECTKASIQQK